MIGVGIVGTGFVANLRGELFAQYPDIKIVGYAGTPHRLSSLAEKFNCAVFPHSEDLINLPAVDLIVVANTNSDHYPIARLALESGKHVVVEYPPALTYHEGLALAELAQRHSKLLHIEHIELLGGVHQAMVTHLPQIGQVFFARYGTKSPQRPAPDKWTYYPDRYGFPLIGALSRLHRFTAVWGEVAQVSCQVRYRGEHLPQRYSYCYCDAQLIFRNGTIVNLHYSKGEYCWQAERSLEIHGERGGLFFQGDSGKLVNTEGEVTLTVAPSRGLFAIDTQQVIAHLLEGKPLYVQPSSSLYALQVAEACRLAAETDKIIDLV
ncbi:MAG: Gfo/Idh/MocA family oxidoreductase [Pseudanabaenaceae cyanobacterium SKYGB_i_bin29]|nr:Gfo/Idh/MocA family oxidoreductase [Pseudanabaenaceae cyanobacterium SKYG29]MDW8422329.1 Gfo/Idh/MocA family oxidoreductase [Pseudanabaenaceae cyanobacterium SKYGB_i_bin29]